jgi:hypothetical protein
MNFFRIPDPEDKFFGEIFLNYLRNPCSFIFISKKKVGFIFHPSFYVQKDPGSKLLGSGIKNL